MTFRKAGHLQMQARWSLTVAAIRRALTMSRTPALQWTIAAAVGLMLALYLLIAIPWRPRWALFLALAALLPFVAMVVRDVRKLLLAIILLETPLHMDFHPLWDGHALALNAIGGLNISVTTFCLAALYALWLAELLAKAAAVPRSLRAGLPALLYLAAVVLSLVVASYPHLAMFEIFMIMQSFLLFVYIIKSVQSGKDLLFVVMLLLTGVIVESLVMIGLYIIGHNMSIAGIKAFVYPGGRVGGTIGSANTAAGYLTLLLAPALGVLLTPLRGRHRWLATLAFGLGSVALVLTFSRGGWLASVVSITLLCLAAIGRGWLSPRVPLVGIVGLVLLLLLFREPIEARLQGDDFGAARARATMMEQGLQVISANPVLGVGANNYAYWVEQHLTSEPDEGRLRTVHNKYLLVWAETGIVGLVAFLGFLLAVIRRGWQGWMRRDPLLSPLALGFAVAILGQMAHMFFDIFHSRPIVQMLWLVAGLVIAMRDIDMGAGERINRSI